MLGRLVDLALRQRLLALFAAIGILAWGVDAYRKLPIDAFPDVSPTQVLVAIQAPGLPPEELESQVTNIVELAMRGIPNLVNIRSITRYATTLMTFEFGPGTDIYWARTQVDQRLDDLESTFPDGVSGGLAPVVTPLGEMLMFTIEGGNLTPMQRRTILDWVIRPGLRGLPGIADVNNLGGFVRTYEVAPDPSAMAARGITTGMLAEALSQNNRNDGAGRVRDGEEALLVRAEGRIHTQDDIRAIVVASHPTGVVRVSDVADVRWGALARNGVVTRNGEGEAVWGIVLGLRGANARTVVNGAKARLAEIQRTLPEGARIEIFYDRNDLIEKAVWTVQKVLLEALALVVVLLILFLGNLRAALVVSLSLPLAVLATFGIMRLYGLSANIMSLGGLAIAIGLLVDCAVVVVENVAHRLAHAHGRTDLQARLRMTAEAVREVAVPLVSGVVIIVTVFLPLLSLQGLEGRLFGPVALTIAFALCSALLFSITLVPALAATVLKAGGGGQDPWLVRKLHAVYDPFLAWAMVNPLKVGAAALAGLVARGRALHPDRLHLHAGDGRGHAGGDLAQAPDGQRRAGGGDRPGHPAADPGAGAGGARHHGPGRRRRARHRPGRAERQRPVPRHRAAQRVAEQARRELRRRRGPQGAGRLPGHLLRGQPADRHAGAGDDHRRPRRRGGEGLRLRHPRAQPHRRARWRRW